MNTYGETPRHDYIRAYFELHLRRYLLNDKWSQTRIHDVVTMLQPRLGERILDAGCGVGTISIEAAKRAASVHGLDYSQDAIRLASELSRITLGKEIIHFRIGSVTEMPFQDGYFRKVVSADLVEHLSERQVELFLNEACRVLAEDGRLIVYTPIIKARPNVAYKLIGKIGGLPFLRTPGWGEPMCYPVLSAGEMERAARKYDYLHVNVMTAYVLLQKITGAGFEVRDVRCSRTYSVLSKVLPFPLNVLWGGHISVLAGKQS